MGFQWYDREDRMLYIMEKDMEDYQQRVVEEAQSLDDKIKKLREFMGTDTWFNELDREEKDLLARQRKHMEMYAYILQKRVARFK